MRSRSGFLATLLVVACAAFFANTTSAGLLHDVNDALQSGADTHLTHQGTYVPLSGGCADVDQDDTWEWVIGSGATCINVHGISAHGLVAAYNKTHTNAYLDGATAAGDKLVLRYNTFSPGRPYAQDVEFLNALAGATHEKSYSNSATSYYGRVITSFPNPNDNVDRHIVPRRSLMGWDVASHIRAAYTSDYKDYALAMLLRVIDQRGSWENIPLGSANYTTLSYGSLLHAMSYFPGHPTLAFQAEIAQALVSSQELDGSWDSGDYQTTAYVLMGLSMLPMTPEVQTTINSGFAFLTSSQNISNGWDYAGTEFGEVNSEVLMALANAPVNNGKHFGQAGNPNNAGIRPQPFDE